MAASTTRRRQRQLSRSAVFGVVAMVAVLVPFAPASAASKPSAPRSLSGTAGPSTGQVSLSWVVPVTNGESPITTYAYSTSIDGGGTWSAVTPFNSTATTQDSTSVPGLTCANTAPGSQGCRYRVYATNAVGTSVASGVAVLWVAPSAPKDLKGGPVDATYAQVALTWTASATTGGLPVTYEVLASMDGGAYASATTTSTTSATVPCTGTQTCAYRVQASNSQGTSAQTNPLTITTKPGPVSTPRVQNTATDLGAGTSSMLVSWYAPRVGMAVDHYDIQQCNLAAGALSGCGAGATWSSTTQVPPSVTDPVTTNATCSAGYSTCYFRVRAVNVRGGASGWRSFDAEPWAPYNVTVVPGPATGQVTIYFSGPSESGLGPNSAKQYRAFVCSSDCGTAASWSDSGLTIPYPPSGSPPHSAGTYACGANASCQVRMQFVDGSSRASIASAAVTSRGAALSITTPADGAVTNDSTPAFAGGCTIGAGNVTVTVTPGPVTFSTTCSGSGTWTTSAPTLADGSYSAQATQANAVGTSNTVNFTVDTTPPVVTVTSPADGSYRNTSSNSFSGGCTTGDGTVTVTIGGAASSTLSAACNSGSWTTSTSLSDGAYTVYASQTDAAGNTGTSATNNFTVDTVAPVVTVTSPANGSYRNTAANTFSGACTTGDGNVTVTIGGTASPTLSAACTLGSWNAGPTTLGDGAYTVYASQTDLAGNTGTSATNNFTVDTVAPVVTLVQPADGSSHNTSSTTFSGACTTGDGNVTVTVIGPPNASFSFACAAGSWSGTGSLPDGSYTAQASQTDAAGNTGTSATHSFTVDTVAPVVSVLAPANNSYVNTATTAFSGLCSTGDGNVTVTVGGAASATFSTPCSAGAWSTTHALADGVYTVYASQTDGAGNTGTSATNNFTVDTTAPVVTVSSPANGSFRNTSSNSFNGTCGTGDGNVTVTVAGPSPNVLSVACSAGLWSAGPVTLLDGAYTIQASQTDAAGNTGTSAVNSFTVDTVAPILTVVSPANGSFRNTASNSFSGTCTPGDGTVTVTVTGPTNASLTSLCTLGNWSAGPTTLTAGAYTVHASQTDAAGNTGTSANNSFTVDLTAPVVTVTNPTANAIRTTSANSFGGACTNGDGLVTVTITNTVTSVVTTTSGACVAGAWSAAAVLSDGSYTVHASQTDAAGNTGQSADVAFKVDTVAPSISFTFPLNGSSHNTTRYNAGCSPVGICGSASDATSGVASVTGTIQRSSDSFFWNGSAWQSASFTLTATGTTSWNIPLAATNLTNGVTYTITARATDAGGLFSTATSAFVYDTTAPTPTTVAVTNHSGSIQTTLDTMTVTYSENLDPATIGATATLSIQRTGNGNTVYSISGFTNGFQATGAKGYLNSAAGSGSFTVSFAGTLTVLTASSVKFTVTGTCTGDCSQLVTTPLLTGNWVYAPATTITDVAGNAATGTSTAVGGM